MLEGLIVESQSFLTDSFTNFFSNQLLERRTWKLIHPVFPILLILQFQFVSTLNFLLFTFHFKIFMQIFSNERSIFSVIRGVFER